MKIKVGKLLKILKAVRPALADKAIVESFVHFLFTGENIITYNGRIYISHPFRFDKKFSIKAAPFYDFLSKVKAENLTVKVKGDALKINGKGIKSEMAINGDPEDPEIDLSDVPDPEEWPELPADFIEGLKLCAMSVDTDPNSEYFNIQYSNEGKVISGDYSRISVYQTEHDQGIEFLIPGSAAKDLIDFEEENLTRYHVHDSYVLFTTDSGAVFCSLKSAVEFPEIDDFFDFTGNKYKLPKSVIKSLDSIMVLSDEVNEDEKRIDVIIEDGKIRCKSDGSMGWAESEEKIKIGKRKIEFAINPEFFRHILNHTTTMKASEERALFQTKKFKHLIALYHEKEQEE